MGKRARLLDRVDPAKKKKDDVQDKEEYLSSSSESESSEVVLPPGTRMSDEKPMKKGKWTNKTRLLVFAARGIGARDRHLMQNIRDLLPHSKADVKIDSKNFALDVDEVASMKNANKCLLFVNKKRKDLFLWTSETGKGPSVKFLVENIHTMEELKMTGNCLKGSRPLLSFDPRFDGSPHYSLIKELLVQSFSTPNHHPKSQPFTDHVMTFTILDHRIWFRNYQLVDEKGALAEVGPRFVLNPIKILEGSFSGTTLWTNPNYISPNERRRDLRNKAKKSYQERVMDKHARIARQPKGKAYKDIDPNIEVFDPITPQEMASFKQ